MKNHRTAAVVTYGSAPDAFLRGEGITMSEPEPRESDDGREEALPRGVDEPGTADPEADTLEQQLLPESGEDTGQDVPHEERPLQEEAQESPESPRGANDADLIEQERAVELDEDDYRE